MISLVRVECSYKGLLEDLGMFSCHEIVLRMRSLHQIYRAVVAFAAEDDRDRVDGILRLDLRPLFPTKAEQLAAIYSFVFPFFPVISCVRTRHESLYTLESQDGQGLLQTYNQTYKRICINVYIYIYNIYIYIYSSIFQVPTNHFLIVPKNL